MGESFQPIDRLLAKVQHENQIPGLAAGIVCSDTLIWSKGYGIRALDDRVPIDPNTLFRVASITKVFTATAITKLRAQGNISLDDPIKEYLPWFEVQRPPHAGNSPITVRHLLTHTSGVPRDSRLTDFARLYQPNREDALAALPTQKLQSPPGETYAYSNLGYGILGEIISETSNMSYTDYLKKEIILPLGMMSSLVHPTTDDTTAWGHGPLIDNKRREKAGFWDLGFATPAGGMASSITDLSKFVISQLAPYSNTDPVIMPTNQIRNMHQLHHVMDSTRGGSGLGWGIEISNDQHLVYHGGELPEQTSFLLVDLQTQLGIIILTNAQDVDTNSMAQDVLRLTREAVLGPNNRFPSKAIPPAPS